MIARLLLAASLLLTTGCIGTMDIWGINVDIPGDGDDDDAAPDIDFGRYDGIEFINIDWDQTQAPAGAVDCIEDSGWNVNGDETTADDQSRCPDCTHIWTLTYVARAGLDECLASTGIDADSGFLRKFGFEFRGSQSFSVWRNFEDPDNAMEEVGEGALREDATYTWGGGSDFRFGGGAYDYYFSGEGAF
jgi:hypothetical protein